MSKHGLLIVAALMVAGPAVARDRTGYAAIAAGDLASAERTLVAERRIYPQRADLMLNLAAVRAQSGRAGEARDLYAAVLAAPPSKMDMPSGETVSSHEIARAGMSRLAGQQMATR